MTKKRAAPVAMHGKHIIWDDNLKKRIRTHLRRGYSLAEFARRTGIPSATINGGARRHGLMECPDGEQFMHELSCLLGITDKTLYARAAALGITPRPWGSQRFTVTDHEAATLSVPTEPAISLQEAQDGGWMTAQEAAQTLGITWRMFMARVQTLNIRRVIVRGLPGRAYRYHPLDVAAARPTPAPKGKPRGYMTAWHLADLTGVTRSAVSKWRKRGCPHIRDRVGYHAAYFHPEHVCAWLESLDDRYWKKADHARRLAAIEALKAFIKERQAA